MRSLIEKGFGFGKKIVEKGKEEKPEPGTGTSHAERRENKKAKQKV